jgi:hypothetical protein
MNPNDYDADHGHDEHHEHEHEVEEALEEALELDTQSQLFLELRRQNLDLLRLATDVAGYGGHGRTWKKENLKDALADIWEVFSEFYTWIDPEEAEDDDEEDLED